MTRKINCQQFMELLDAMAADTIDPPGRQSLAEHAANCEDCAALLAMQRHLSHPSRSELETQVPESWVRGMGARIQAAAETNGALSRPPWRRPVILLATLSLCLLSISTFLLFEQQRLARENRRLALLMEHRQGIEAAGTAISAPAISTSRRSKTAVVSQLEPVWRLILSGTGQDKRAFDLLIDKLTGLPPGTLILEPAMAHALMRELPLDQRAVGRRLQARIEMSDGLQAGEVLSLLEMISTDPGSQVWRTRLLGMLSSIDPRQLDSRTET